MLLLRRGVPFCLKPAFLTSHPHTHARTHARTRIVPPTRACVACVLQTLLNEELARVRRDARVVAELDALMAALKQVSEPFPVHPSPIYSVRKAVFLHTIHRVDPFFLTRAFCVASSCCVCDGVHNPPPYLFSGRPKTVTCK